MHTSSNSSPQVQPAKHCPFVFAIREPFRVFVGNPRIVVLFYFQSANRCPFLIAIGEALLVCVPPSDAIKRMVFPRLYFVSDAHLLELLAAGPACEASSFFFCNPRIGVLLCLQSASLCPFLFLICEALLFDVPPSDAMVFPRLYFVSDAHLLELLAAGPARKALSFGVRHPRIVIHFWLQSANRCPFAFTIRDSLSFSVPNPPSVARCCDVSLPDAIALVHLSVLSVQPSEHFSPSPNSPRLKLVRSVIRET